MQFHDTYPKNLEMHVGNIHAVSHSVVWVIVLSHMLWYEKKNKTKQDSLSALQMASNPCMGRGFA